MSTPLFNQLQWLPISSKIKYEKLCLSFKPLHDISPILLCSLSPSTCSVSSDTSLLDLPYTWHSVCQVQASSLTPTPSPPNAEISPSSSPYPGIIGFLQVSVKIPKARSLSQFYLILVSSLLDHLQFIL